MPLEQDVHGHTQDYGYRSTLSSKDLENRYDQDMLDDVGVAVRRAVSPSWSSTRRSPSRPSSGVGRPPLPKQGLRNRSDSPGTGSRDCVEVWDGSPQQINILTIDGQFENTNQNSRHHDTENSFVESVDGYDETHAPMRVAPSSASSVKSASDQPHSSSWARRQYSRREKNSVGNTSSTEQPHSSPSLQSLDVAEVPNRVTVEDRPDPDARSQLALDGTRTVEAMPGSENEDRKHSSLESYRDVQHEDVTGTVRKRDDDEDDADSYGAYDTSDQLLDTLTEYQQKLEKTNFVDEADDDSMEDTVTRLDGTAPVPLPRRHPQSKSPPQPESPSDSLDVSELEEDEYLEC